MSAGCLRRALSHALRALYGRNSALAASLRWSLLSTTAGGSGETPAPRPANKRPQGHQVRGAIRNVGRRIPHPHVQLISETAENLGVMQRAHVLRVMDERGLKLVLLNERKDPPVYQLMSGHQMHEERTKLREKLKSQAAPVQLKELVLSSGIAAHDLKIKLKQVESWLAKKDHVKVTLRKHRQQQTGNMDVALDEMLQNMEVMVGFVSKPHVTQNGKAAVCVLRPPSAKELSLKKQSESSPVQSAQTDACPIPRTELADGSDGTKQ